uniref:U-box domain-containing protein n=3 Tax=Oryza TaxID=4527 RepID=A0A0E0PGE0_ORYRU
MDRLLFLVLGDDAFSDYIQLQVPINFLKKRKRRKKCSNRSKTGRKTNQIQEAASMATAADGVAAIALCPDVAVYWLNRGLCHFKRKEWAKVEEDSRRALALDDTLVKGHYLLGCAMLEKEQCALAIKEFNKALDLLKSSNLGDKMAEDIWQVLAKAKYQDWEIHSTKRVWKMQSLKEACENALQEHHFLSGTLVGDGSTNEYTDQLKLLSEVFTKATIDDTPTDVGNFDPVTREPLKEHQLVPNLAIKEAVQAYLKNHSWAYKLN